MDNNLNINEDSIDRGRRQFLHEVFPAELREIIKRRKAYPEIYRKDDIERLEEKLESIKKADQEFREAEKKLNKFSGVREMIRDLIKKEESEEKKECKKDYDEKIENLIKECKAVKIPTSHGLVGLAFSGGGIRSATFSLGVLQSLAKNGILKYVDYLSTVSGGGYLGACVSSIFNDDTASTEWKYFPFYHEPGEEEPDGVKKLRNSGNYLAPDGFLDRIRIPALLLRGVLVNFLTFLPYIILAVLLTNLWFGDKILEIEKQTGFFITEKSLRLLKSKELPPTVLNDLAPLQNQLLKDKVYASKTIKKAIGGDAAKKYESMILKSASRPFEWKKFYRWTPLAAVLLAAWVVLFPIVQFFGRSRLELNWSLRNKYGRSFGAILVAAILIAIGESLPPTLLYLKLNWWETDSGDFWTAVISILSLIPYAFSYKASKNVSRWTGKLALAALGLLGPMIFLLIYFHLSYWNIFYYEKGYLGLENVKWWPWIYLGAAVIWLYTLRFVDVNSTSLHSFYRDRLSKAYLFKVRPTAFKITQDTIDALKKKKTNDYNDNETLTEALNKLDGLKNKETQCKEDEEAQCKEEFEKVLKDTLSSGQMQEYKKDVLRAAVSKESIESNDEQQLHTLNQENTLAPYHLINAALNLQNSDDINLRGRDSDLFIFSKHFTGCERTGFFKTSALEDFDQHMDLGTAMAISGAAAAPNMGTTTIKPLVFIMTMLNVRLGYWMPNPKRCSKDNKKKKIRFGVGPIYLLRELFSRINEKRAYINVSDGGHIENLGIYQLLRRRCKFIIACDAEADAGMSFGGLAKLIRYARTDMGIDIDIELEDLRLQGNGLSRKHCALGTIRYSKEETGKLLYIKSSLSGDENEYIWQYHTHNPDFPHESTANQFFDEAQFEVYRALGHHIVDELFPKRQGQKWGKQKKKLKNQEKEFYMLNWFNEMLPYLRPRFNMEEDFIMLHEQLGIIEKQLKRPEVAEYSYQIYPEMTPDTFRYAKTPGTKDEQSRKIFHLCNLQMQLMENVYIALNLDNPTMQNHHFTRGWMNLFRRWAQANHFRRAWAVSIGTYCAGFQTFCNVALELKCEVRWSACSENDLTWHEKKYLNTLKQDGRFDENAVFDPKEQGIVKQDQIRIAKMFIRSRPRDKDCELISFPVGFAALRINEREKFIELTYYSIREYYRKMRLLDRLIPNLKEYIADDESLPFKEIRIDLSKIPDGKCLRDFFQGFGYGITE